MSTDENEKRARGWIETLRAWRDVSFEPELLDSIVLDLANRLDDAEARGAAAERARIVAEIRALPADESRREERRVVAEVADAVESGDHNSPAAEKEEDR